MCDYAEGTVVCIGGIKWFMTGIHNVTSICIYITSKNTRQLAQLFMLPNVHTVIT